MTDEPMAHELAIWCINDAQLYRSMAKSIIQNYAVKMVKGVYDPKKALIGWVNLVEEGLQGYKKKFPGYSRVDKSTKIHAAKMIEEHYKKELQEKSLELYDLKKKGKAWQRRTD